MQEKKKLYKLGHTFTFTFILFFFSLSLVAKRGAEKNMAAVVFFVLFSFFVPYVPGPLQEAIWNLMGRSETFASSWPC